MKNLTQIGNEIAEVLSKLYDIGAGCVGDDAVAVGVRHRVSKAIDELEWIINILE